MKNLIQCGFVSFFLIFVTLISFFSDVSFVVKNIDDDNLSIYLEQISQNSNNSKERDPGDTQFNNSKNKNIASKNVDDIFLYLLIFISLCILLSLIGLCVALIKKGGENKFEEFKKIYVSLENFLSKNYLEKICQIHEEYKTTQNANFKSLQSQMDKILNTLQKEKKKKRDKNKFSVIDNKFSDSIKIDSNSLTMNAIELKKLLQRMIKLCNQLDQRLSNIENKSKQSNNEVA